MDLMIKNKEGVTLHTANKYCKEDISVGVETEEITIIPNKEQQIKEGLFTKVTVEPVPVDEASWDSSQITSAYQMFYNNRDMIEAPFFNIENAKTIESMFQSCTNLITVPAYNFKNATNMKNAFKSCSSLTTVGEINTEKATTLYGTFHECSKLTNIPKMNTSQVTSMNYAFNAMYQIQTIPELDTSKVTSMEHMCRNCSRLISIPKLNTEKVTSMYYSFANCSNLTDIAELDGSSITNIYGIFYQSASVTNFIGLKDLGKAYTQKTQNYSNYSFDLTPCVLLTYDSLINIIDNLYDLNLTYDVANGGTLYMQTLKLGSTNLAKLTAEEIAIATAKGWNVT